MSGRASSSRNGGIEAAEAGPGSERGGMMDYHVRSKYASDLGGGEAGPSSRRNSPGHSSSYQRNSSLPQPRSAPDLHGRARKRAELNRLNQEIRYLEDELERLDTLPPASDICRMFVLSIQSQQDDPFITSRNSTNWDPQWDRWLLGPPPPKPACCCIPATLS